MLNIYTVRFEVYKDDQLINNHRMAAPRFMIQSQFLSMCEEAARNHESHFIIKMCRDVEVWLPQEQKFKILTNYIKYDNQE